VYCCSCCAKLVIAKRAQMNVNKIFLITFYLALIKM
jgi:hypothetical protein